MSLHSDTLSWFPANRKQQSTHTCHSTLIHYPDSRPTVNNSPLIHVTRFVTRVKRQLPHVEQELLTPAPEFTHGFSGVRVTLYIVFCVMFWRSFFVLLYFFFWSLCCLFFDLRLLIAPLVSSNCSCYSTFSFICMFCRSLFVLLYFFFWSLCCLSFYLWLLISPLVSSNFSCYLIFSFICMFCRSLFVLLYFFFWSLCCLFFFYLWLLIAPLVSSHCSCYSIFSFICMFCR
jgi:hypothetical protein